MLIKYIDQWDMLTKANKTFPKHRLMRLLIRSVFEFTPHDR